jgi:hypothetical protein
MQKSKIRKVKQWDMRSLAAMNEGTSSSSSNNTGMEKIIGTKQKRRADPPSSTVADVLLTEVNVRLASQHKKCIDMMDRLQSSADDGSSSSVRSDRHPSTSTTQNQKKVIRAINLPISLQKGLTLKQWTERTQKVQQKKEKALQTLQNLEILHADTFAITEHLLSNDKPTLERFSKADQALIAATFEQIRSRHAATVENMADLVIGLRGAGVDDVDDDRDDDRDDAASITHHPMDEGLVDEFLRDRLGIQLLCDHYVGMHKGKPGGGISVDCDFHDVLTDAILESKSICDANFGIVPEVHIVDNDRETVGSNSDLDSDSGSQELPIIPVTLIRPWIHHALVELLKNGMTSSVQRASLDSKGAVMDHSELPHIFIRIHDKSPSHIICEVMDQGVGLSNEGIQRGFQFAESSSQQRWDRIDEQQSYAMVRAPIGSLGVGLPLSRMMMGKFGGDVLLEGRLEDQSLSVDNDVMVAKSGCSASVVVPLRDDIPELF